MKDPGTTKGEWYACCLDKKPHFVFAGDGEAVVCAISINDPNYAGYEMLMSDVSLLECQHNARLIQDAGNVAQECGLLPSELLKQRDNLKSELKTTMESLLKSMKQRDELLEDIEFLAKRQQKASSISFYGERDTGVSSNCIVSIAYGVTKLEDQSFPSDLSDMIACENMWKKLPAHRKTGDGLTAMERARGCDYYGKAITKAEER